MVHIEKFKVNGNIYFKLVHSIRVNGKVKSKSRYIGKELPPPEELEKLKLNFYKEIQSARKLNPLIKNSNFKKLSNNSNNTNSINQIKKMDNIKDIKIDNFNKEKITNKSLFNFDFSNFETETIIDSSNDLTYISNSINFNMIYVNSSIKEILGYTKNNCINNPHLLIDKIYEEDKKKVLEKIWESKKNLSPITMDYRILKNNGRVIWITNKIFWIKDINRKNLLLVGIIKEISSFKESEEKLRLLFDNSPMGLLEQDYSEIKRYLTINKLRNELDIKNHFKKNPKKLDQVIAMVKVNNLNKSTINLFKAKDKESFLSAYFSRNFSRDSNEVFIDELISIANNETNFESELKIYTLDGKKIQIVIKWTVPDMYKKTYDKVLITLINTQLQKQLAETIYIKNYAIESSASGILITDLDGKINYANASFYKLWNLKGLIDVLGSSVGDFLPFKQGAQKVLQLLLLDKKWQGEIKIGKDKPTFLELHAVFVSDEYGIPIGLVFSYINVTEHKVTEQIRLEFTNIAAHELKTPIVPLKTFIKMILDSPLKYNINDKGKKLLEVCERNVNRLNMLIGDILDISRLEAKGMKFNFQKFNILDIIKNEIENFKSACIEKGLEFESEIPENMPLIKGDISRIQQVIGNLFKNSIKFTEKGKIIIKASFNSDNIDISIIDTGMGILKKDIPKLFTKFYQAEDITTRKTKGSGLGLAISQEIIKAHGGIITADSKGKGKGSTFTITLPIKGPSTSKETRIPQNNKDTPLTELDTKDLIKSINPKIKNDKQSDNTKYNTQNKKDVNISNKKKLINKKEIINNEKVIKNKDQSPNNEESNK